MKKELFASLFFLLMGCDAVKVTTATADPAPPAFDVQGHRGTRGLMPENTIPAFLKALDLGVNTLEMDAAITKDNQVIISHDPFINHDIALRPDGTTINAVDEKNINIYKMDYEELKKFDVGSKKNAAFPRQQKLKVSKPLLSDVIDSAEAHAARTKRALPYYNIEIKSYAPLDNIFYPGVEKYTDLVMSVIESKNIQARVIIQSFDVRALKYMHQKYPSVRLSLNVDAFGDMSFDSRLKDLGFTPYIFSTNEKQVTEQLVQECRQKGIKIIPYTVNDIADMKRLKAMGVDGFITDYPDNAKKL